MLYNGAIMAILPAQFISHFTNETEYYSLQAVSSFGSSFTGFPRPVGHSMNGAILSSQSPFTPFTRPLGHSINTVNAIRCCYYAEIALNNLFLFHEPDCIFRAFIFLIYDITSNFGRAVQCKISAVR
jgi:hypothetical protein